MKKARLPITIAAITVPLGGVGYVSGSVFLPLPVLVLASVTFVYIIIGDINLIRFDKGLLISTSLLLAFWSFGNLWSGNAVLSFLPSAIILVLLIVSASLRLGNKISPNGVYTIIKSFSISILVTGVFDVLSWFSREIESIQMLILQRARTYPVLGIPRLHGFMQEPAHFAIVGFLSIVLLDLLLKNADKFLSSDQDQKIVKFLKRAILVMIVFTFSMTGLVLLIAYFALGRIRSRRDRMKLVTWGVIGGFVILSSLSVGIGDGYFQYFKERTVRTVRAVGSGSFSGSEGLRSNSLLIGRDFISFSDPIHLFLGVGYSNGEVWLVDYYGHIAEKLGWDPSKMIQNAFVSLLISTGVVGLLMYIFLFLRVYSQLNFSGSETVMACLFLLHFTSGYVLIDWYWFTVLVLFLINDSKRTALFTKPEEITIHKTRGLVE